MILTYLVVNIVYNLISLYFYGTELVVGFQSVRISDVSRVPRVVQIFISVLTFRRMHGNARCESAARESAGINIAHSCETRTAP